MSSKKSWVALIILLAVCALTLSAIVAAFAYDTYRDRQHTLTFAEGVRVFENPEARGRDRKDIVAILKRDDHVRVLRIWYGKDYEGVRIELSDGRTGYLISGESGSYSLRN